MYNLNKTKLVTFDVFGTVLDWRTHVESQLPGAYDQFISLSNTRQRRDHPVVPYARLLREVFSEIKPEAGAEAGRQFGASFGEAAPFSDYKALRELRHLVPLGCISNCDYRHQMQAQQTLGFVWDICVVAEELGHYKPTHAAWEQAVKTITAQTGVTPDEWLHVTAYADYDLIPAKEFGLRTCFIPRPGGSDTKKAEALNPDVIASDLDHLYRQFVAATGAPVRYQVTARSDSPDTLREFCTWMRREHGDDLLKVKGCLEFRVFKVSDDEIQCDYLFQNQARLDHYFEHEAAKLRDKGRRLFPEAKVSFARATAGLEASGSSRFS